MRARLEAINRRIAAACGRAGRQVSEITLVAASKTVPAPRIREAIEAGVRVIGENRVQEAATKISELGAIAAEHGAIAAEHGAIAADYKVQWHLIGRLQSNKARRAVELFDVVQSVESLKLAERLDHIAGELGKRLPIFIEVNLGGEASKAGAVPDEVLSLCEQISKLSNLELKGLMAVPPFFDNPEDARPFFQRLRRMRDRAAEAGAAGEQFNDLSMGMSNDFEVAIEEGATLVRIGTELFGARDHT
ncbi:MAG TPA: YggS family pyridoxal phosphate-dependent enzyme [Blastocatellia bacterium]|nr:YggS family pyridoxal phosphate-dependent enzyme [Blastocatellia bacterium]